MNRLSMTTAGLKPVEPEPHPSRSLRIWQILVIFLGVAYLLQLPTPIRLGIDSLVLMAEGESVAHGTGFLDSGHQTPFPPGYPAVLAFLLKIGFASPAVLVGFNLICMAVGLIALRLLLRGPMEQPEEVTLETICAFLLSYVVIKHTLMPLTDVPYFGLSLACLAILAYSEQMPLGKRYYIAVFAAALLLFGALAMRRVGLALLPAFVWATLSRKELRRSPRFTLDGNTVGPVLATLVIVPVALFWVQSYTIRDYHAAANGSIRSVVLDDIVNHSTEIGELCVNVPQRLVPRFLQIWPLFCLGLGLSALILTGLLERLRRFCAMDIYFIAYVGVILVWPYRDPRFWLPALPFLIAYLRAGFLTWFRSRTFRPFVWSFKAAFALTGMVALVYTTKLSYSGPNFPDRYAAGPFRATYCAALNLCPGAYNTKEVDPKAFHILQAYR
jgi:hypothetical protein